MSEPKRVLQVIGAMDRGGAETFIMNLYRKIDRNRIQFDFLVHTDSPCDYDQEIVSMGGNIYRLPRFYGVNLFEYKRACADFFNQHHDYAAVHGHIGSSAAIYLTEAKKHGIFTIAHSHNTKSKNLLRRISFGAVSYPTRFIADYFIGCSQQAGVDRFGNGVAQSDRFAFIPNGIDVDAFRFNDAERESVRQELGIDSSTFVVGTIGRLTEQKNQSFAISAFWEIHRQINNSVFIIVGRGELEKRLKQQVSDLHLEGSVKFLGVREDTARLYSAMDVFVLTSLWEGLPVVSIEAQASGLPCFFSSAVTKEACVSDCVHYLDVASDVSAWAKEICEARNDWGGVDVHGVRLSRADSVRDRGFDITQAMVKMTNLYLNHC